MTPSFHIQSREAQTTSVYSFWMDGCRIDWFENKWHLTGGWNNVEPNPEYPGLEIRDVHITSDDEGVTWNAITPVPWYPRHTHGHGVYGGFLWISGGNDVIDLWKYSTATGWVEVTVTGVSIELDHFSTIMVGKYIYFLGGNLSPTTSPSNDVYRLDVETGVLSHVAELPAEMHSLNSGCLLYFKGAFIFFGGGKFNVNPAPDINNINTKVFRSTDGMLTWEEIADTELLNSGLWGDAVATRNAIIYVSGSDEQNSVTANNRTLVSYDGIVWFEPVFKMPTGRHATAINVDDVGDVYSGMGLSMNDFWKFQLVATMRGAA